MTGRKALTGGIVLLSAVAAVMILAWLPGCKVTTHDIAVHMVRGLQQTRNLTGSQLGAGMRITYASCKAKHPGDKPALKACIKPALDLQAKWKGYIRPVVDTTAQSGKAVLQTKVVVDRCKREKNCDKVIFAIIKPGACAILRGLTAFGHLLADKGAAILASLGIFEGVICD